MNLKEQMAQAKENLAAITAAVESGEKGADELSAAIDNVKGLQTKLDAAAEAAELMKGLDNSDSA